MSDITIAIPTYNRLKLLQEALKSVEKQTSDNFNLLIIDNCSDDGSVDFLNQFKNITKIKKLRIIFNSSNIGLVNNINKCFELSNTKFVTILSDDDFLEKFFVEIVNKSLELEKNGMLIVGHNIVDRNLNIISTFNYKSNSYSYKESFKSLFYERIHVAGISGIIFNKMLCKNKLYMKKFPNGLYSDFEMYYNLAISHGLSTLDVILYNRRQWGNNTSSLKLNFMLLKKIYLQNKAYSQFIKSLRLLILSHENLFSKDEFLKLKKDFEKNYNNNLFIEILRNKLSFFKRVE